MVRRYDDVPLVAAVGFNPYTADAECAGGLIMAAIGGDDAVVSDDLANEVFDSVSLSGELAQLPDLGDHYESSEFALDIPPGWVAAERPVGATGQRLPGSRVRQRLERPRHHGATARTDRRRLRPGPLDLLPASRRSSPSSSSSAAGTSTCRAARPPRS